MNPLTVLAATIVLFTFVVSLLAKLSGTKQFAMSLTAFDVPYRLTFLAAVVILLSEATMIGLMVFGPLWLAGTMAAGLLVLFTVVLGVTLMRGRTPRCACFGSMGTAPISFRTILRNLGLLVAAGWLWQESRTFAELLRGLSRSETIEAFLLLVVSVLLWVIYILLERYGEALKALDAAGVKSSAFQADLDPSQGSLLPDLRLEHDAGGFVSLRELVRETGSRAIVLLSDTCPHCPEIIPSLDGAASSGKIGVVMVSGGSRGLRDQLAGIRDKGWSLAYSTDGNTLSAFHAVGYPALIPLGTRGEAQGGVLLGSERIRQLFAS